MKSLAFFSKDAKEAVDLACRLHGAKRGWAVAGELLGISERTARALAYGETSGATIDPDTAFAVRMTLRRQRAEQIRAELRELEIPHGDMPRNPGGATPPSASSLGVCG